MGRGRRHQGLASLGGDPQAWLPVCSRPWPGQQLQREHLAAISGVVGLLSTGAQGAPFLHLPQLLGTMTPNCECKPWRAFAEPRRVLAQRTPVPGGPAGSLQPCATSALFSGP